MGVVLALRTGVWMDVAPLAHIGQSTVCSAIRASSTIIFTLQVWHIRMGIPPILSGISRKGGTFPAKRGRRYG